MNTEIMKRMGFGKEVSLVEQGLCPFCQEVVKEADFRDALSRKEFTISGLCQKCQDNTFGN